MKVLPLFAIAVGTLTAFGVAVLSAQTQAKAERIAYLSGLSEQAAARDDALPAFRSGLHELGWVEGRTVVLDVRYAERHFERFPELVTDVIKQGADVIVVGSYPAVVAAKQVTSKIPIVASTCGMELLVQSFARPEANITGVTCRSPELIPKQLQLLQEALPGVRRIAVLYNPSSGYAQLALRDLRDVAPTLGIRLIEAEVSGPEQFAAAIARIRQAGAEAVFLTPDAMIFYNRVPLLQLLLDNRLPTIGFFGEFTDAGGLMSYSASLPAQYHRLAWYVDRILRGAKPGDLPVEQPTSFELVINLKTAKALGLTIPKAVLNRADRKVE